ncbi:MAG: ABC transporter permease [Pseudonocardia sp.]|uniref:ABC transporter permease n=1 Tax=unclassified Pseudonocardia TaxID=2619320 RepID=UPI00086B53CE|nr:MULTISPECIES: ABC transporter permease [unclassified Pseudonocardia]MBN9110453.1 ABC transporter permease [Pseudonocardia sp.]ODU29775.1 MAG: hypothetical protein ABS80_01280 [Pseudonocardia sp. SCN 72-51]ODV03466.1 MAG: hypothetical protein ABT15_22815 [Pseudonocardia sp. SCN 73-27]
MSTEVLARPAAPARARRGSRTTTTVWAARIGLVVVVLAGWQLMAGLDRSWELVVSSPGQVAQEAAALAVSPGWWADVGVTLREAAGGYLLGMACAVLLVAVFVPFRSLATFSSPFLAALNAIPHVALAPLFIVWLGFGYASKLVYVATSTFFIGFYGIYVGVRQIDRSLLDNARVQGASTAELVRHVFVPAVATWVLGSLRAAAAWALLAAVVAEFLGSRAGIGFRVATATQTLQTATVIAIILFVAALAFVLDRSLVRLERRMSNWRIF